MSAGERRDLIAGAVAGAVIGTAAVAALLIVPSRIRRIGGGRHG